MLLRIYTYKTHKHTHTYTLFFANTNTRTRYVTYRQMHIQTQIQQQDVFMRYYVDPLKAFYFNLSYLFCFCFFRLSSYTFYATFRLWRMYVSVYFCEASKDKRIATYNIFLSPLHTFRRSIIQIQVLLDQCICVLELDGKCFSFKMCTRRWN